MNDCHHHCPTCVCRKLPTLIGKEQLSFLVESLEPGSMVGVNHLQNVLYGFVHPADALKDILGREKA